MKNNKKRRQSWWLAGIVISAALMGLFFIGSTSTDVEATTNSADNLSATQVDVGSSLMESAMPSMFRMVSALIIVIACIYGALFLLKRLQRNRFNGRKGNVILEVIETTCLAPKKTISLVRVGEKSVLVGISEGQMNLLTELDADQTTAVMAEPEIVEETQPFSGSLAQAFKRLQTATFRDKAALES